MRHPLVDNKLEKLFEVNGVSKQIQDNQYWVIENLVRESAIPNMSTVEIGCLSGDTKIPLLDGRILTISEIYKKYPNGGIYVYSYDTEIKQIVPGKVILATLTQKNVQTIKIILDNGNAIKCTPEHKFMLRNGTYKEAKNLTTEDSLMPFNRSFSPKGYEIISLNNGEEKYTHVWSWEYFNGKIEKNKLIHHDIFNIDNFNPYKTNNDPRFLKLMDGKEHFLLHSGKTKELLKIRPELKELIDKKIEINEKNWNEYCKIFHPKYPLYKTAIKLGLINHKISKIEKSEFLDVYDLSIEKHHNFAIDSGIIIHNSWSGNSAVIIGSVVQRVFGTHYCIDWYKGDEMNDGYLKETVEKFDVPAVFLNNIKYFKLTDTVKLNIMSSEEGSKLFENETLAFIFIDGSHLYEQVLQDINLWYPKLRRGGILSGHDYEMTKKVVNEEFPEATIKEDIWSIKKD